MTFDDDLTAFMGRPVTRAEALTITVDRMKDEIIADARRDPRYLEAASYSDLHDYCDANYYGGRRGTRPTVGSLASGSW